jgi:hypothetical protein
MKLNPNEAKSKEMQREARLQDVDIEATSPIILAFSHKMKTSYTLHFG